MSSLAFFGEPRIPRLSKLLEEIRSGEIRVPRFQRPFVWTDEQRLALMESIYSGYPIGAILVWRTQEHRLVTHERLGPLALPFDEGRAGTRQYLLDGHQRLTTLFAALGPGIYSREDLETPELSKDDATHWPIYFDLEFDRSKGEEQAADARPFRLPRRRERLPSTWLPLSLLFNSYALRAVEETLKRQGSDRKLVNRVQAVADAFRDYAIPVMPIATEDLRQVTTSFKRINSGGTPMSEVHMVNALVWSPSFDLLTRMEEVASDLAGVGWQSFEPQMILNVCKARLGIALYDEQPEAIAEKLRGAPEVLTAVRDDILRAADLLGELVGVRGPYSLPYGYQAVLLADALRDRNRLTKETRSALREWFWSTTLAEYFRGMTKALFERARRHLHQLVRGKTSAHPPDMSLVVEPTSRFDFRSARSRAIGLLLAELGPIDPQGRSLDAFDLLATHGNDSVLKLLTDGGSRELRDGPANRFLLEPHALRDMRQMQDGMCVFESEAFLRSHAITAAARRALLHGEVEEFLGSRSAELIRLEGERVRECRLQYRAQPER